MSVGFPMPFVKRQFFTDDGIVADGYLLNVYLAGTDTRTPSYTTSALGVQNTNPVELNAAGQADIYLDPTLTYKFVFTDPDGVPVWSEDNVPGNIPPLAPWTLQTDGIGATSTDGLVLKNAALAANATQQYSPRVRWTGAGWNATSGASRVCDWVADVRPEQQVSGEPISSLVFASQVNANGFTPRFAFKSSGVFALAPNTTIGWSSSGLTSVDTFVGRAAAMVLFCQDTGSNGCRLNFATTATLKLRNLADSDDADFYAKSASFSGSMTFTGTAPRITMPTDGLFLFGNRGSISSPSDGRWLLANDDASKKVLLRVPADSQIWFRNAADSAYAAIGCSSATLTFDGVLTFGNRGSLSASADGHWLLTNTAASNGVTLDFTTTADRLIVRNKADNADGTIKSAGFFKGANEALYANGINFPSNAATLITVVNGQITAIS